MTNESTDRALLDFITLVDAGDYTNIVVEVRAAGVSYKGRLISEVAYRRSITTVVEKGNAASTAALYRQYEQMAEEKRAENARRVAGRPDTPTPTVPEALHILVGEGDSAQVWRLRLEAIDGWTLLSFTVDATEA
ncbi:hypothetical protein AB0G64_11065 [Streptomyces longwoodensis]|uniref:hypothetical protein n=1 Tax=Streptomyces longwoodensis TaxID=68231 RepID=UPI0033E85588